MSGSGRSPMTTSDSIVLHRCDLVLHNESASEVEFYEAMDWFVLHQTEQLKQAEGLVTIRRDNKLLPLPYNWH
jgi:hypothetical protein